MVERKIFSTLVVNCGKTEDDVDAIVVIFDNGDKEVTCPHSCDSCIYGKLIKIS